MLGAGPATRVRAARPDRRGFGFVGLGVALGALLVAGNRSVYALESGFADLADLLPVGYAFGAGMVAAVNPCGVLLLPSLVAYYLATAAPTGSAAARAGGAVLLAAMATLGFVAVFGAVGLVVGAGGAAVASLFPLGGLVVGVALVGLGAWLALSGEGFGLVAAGRAMGSLRLGGLRSLFLFGVAYAVCSLACTLPIFLVVAGTALAAGGAIAAAREFTAYALGMGAVLTIVVVAAALFEGATRRWLRAVVPHVHRLSAAFLLGAGIFVVDYWLRGAGLPG
jgi:cytochrome c biogenesis protein CcdA